MWNLTYIWLEFQISWSKVKLKEHWNSSISLPRFAHVWWATQTNQGRKEILRASHFSWPVSIICLQCSEDVDCSLQRSCDCFIRYLLPFTHLHLSNCLLELLLPQQLQFNFIDFSYKTKGFCYQLHFEFRGLNTKKLERVLNDWFLNESQPHH